MSSLIGIWSDCRGTASVEGVIVLPVFILLFGIVTSENRVSSQSHALRQEIRQRIWTRATSGCELGEPHPFVQGVLDTPNFRTFRARMPRLAKLADKIRWNVQYATGRKNVDGFLGGSKEIFHDYTLVCNEKLPNTEAATPYAIRDGVCAAGGCEPAGCECSVGAGQCVTSYFERTCIEYESCGIWGLPVRCDENEACFDRGCEPCDPTPGDGTNDDLPECPEAQRDGEGIIIDLEEW